MASDLTQVQDVASASLSSVTRPVPPLEIKSLLVSLVRADSQLRTLLGVTANDPRIYPYYQPEAVIDPARRLYAYITYATTAQPEHTRAVGEPVYTLAVWANNWTTAEQVRDRLVALLSERELTTASGKKIWGTRVNEHDNYQEHTKFSGKNIMFRFGFSTV